LEIISHLLFVDDVIMFGAETCSKIKDLRNILDLFYRSTGMQVNIGNSLVLLNVLHEESANKLQGSLMFKKNGLDEGIKYLGFMLKPNEYDFRDWMWLYVKFKKESCFGLIDGCQEVEYWYY